MEPYPNNNFSHAIEYLQARFLSSPNSSLQDFVDEALRFIKVSLEPNQRVFTDQDLHEQAKAILLLAITQAIENSNWNRERRFGTGYNQYIRNDRPEDYGSRGERYPGIRQSYERYGGDPWRDPYDNRGNRGADYGYFEGTGEQNRRGYDERRSYDQGDTGVPPPTSANPGSDFSGGEMGAEGRTASDNPIPGEPPGL